MENIKIYLSNLLEIERHWLITAVITLVLSLTMLALGNILGVEGYLDYSWMLALHEFFAAKKQFGTEIIFTYGPYGFLFTRMYHPKTYWLTNLGWLFFSLVFWWSSFYISYKLIKNKWLVLLWFFTLFFLFSNFNLPDTTFLYFYIFYLIHKLYIEDKIALFNSNLLIVSLSLISLIKFSFFVMALPIIVFITIYDIFQKRFPFQLILFILTFTSFWLLAGQNIFFIPTYIKNALEITVFYNYSMTPVFSVELLDLIGVICFFILSLVTNLAINWKKTWIEIIVSFLSFSYIVFILLKAGYGRIDMLHLISYYNMLCFIAIVYVVICFKEKTNIGAKTLTLLTLFFVVCNFQIGLYRGAAPNSFFTATQNLKLVAKNIKRCWLISTGELSSQKQHEEEMQKLRSRWQMPKLTGSVDLYPYLQIIAIANELEYRPRPVFQSYSAYSPTLAKANLDHLKTTPPDKIIFSNKTIDERYPTLDDGLSWPEFLTKYEVKDFFDVGRFLVLEKSPFPKEYSFVSEKTFETHLNEKVQVPKMNLGAVWVKVDVKYSFWGKVMSFFYKPAPIHLTLTKIDGTQLVYFLPTPLAETGFLLSPLIEDNLDFLKFANQSWQTLLSQQEVQSIVITCDRQMLWQFIPEIKVTFSHLIFERHQMSGKFSFSQ